MTEILAALQREFSRSGREDKPATSILADIDHCKRVNDSLGHGAGDEVLKEVAKRLKSDLRPYDVVGGYGGEEFLIILPGCDLTVGARRANEIRSLVARNPIQTPAGKAAVTLSMGVTVTSSARDHTISDVLREADVSQYEAKKNGRSHVEVFSLAARRNAAAQN